MSGGIQLAASPHPFQMQRIHRDVEPGATLADIVAAHDLDPGEGCEARLLLNDQVIPREDWDRIRPPAGSLVNVNVIPEGGGGKNPLRTILTVAVTAGAAAISGGTLVPGVAGLSAATASSIASVAFAPVAPFIINRRSL